MPAVTRIGDADVMHCTPMVRMEGATGTPDLTPSLFEIEDPDTVKGGVFIITKIAASYTGIQINPGLNYVPGNEITIKGSNLGGKDGTNDATITITEVLPLGLIKSITVSGTGRIVNKGGVYANNIPVSRQGDKNTPHFAPPHNKDTHPICTLHQAAITTGSTTVFINGKGCGRVGDALTGCTAVAQGSPNVFAGG